MSVNQFKTTDSAPEKWSNMMENDVDSQNNC